MRLRQLVPLYLRLALGAGFLSAVADRFGLWGPPGADGVAWGSFDAFLEYTALLNPWAPGSLVPLLGWTVTILEVALGLLLLVGYRTRPAAAGAGLLLLAFGLGMTWGTGVKSALDASVFAASAGALLLFLHPGSSLGVDAVVGDEDGVAGH